jgi:hypothetical protein
VLKKIVCDYNLVKELWQDKDAGSIAHLLKKGEIGDTLSGQKKKPLILCETKLMHKNKELQCIDRFLFPVIPRHNGYSLDPQIPTRLRI